MFCGLWEVQDLRDEHEQNLQEGKDIVFETFDVSFFRVLNRKKTV